MWHYEIFSKDARKRMANKYMLNLEVIRYSVGFSRLANMIANKIE